MVITGGDGLVRFLEDLTGEGGLGVSIPTTLNSAGCDADRMEEMDLGRDGFLEAQLNIVDAYTKLGIRPTLSCTPYDRGENRGRHRVLGGIQRGVLCQFMDQMGPGNRHRLWPRP